MTSITTTAIGPGDLVDHYRIEDLIASGAIASVFRATDIATGRGVAVKIPHPGALRDAFVRDRFHSETEIGRKFDHPGLVKVLPSDGANGRYAVMEWIEGRALREIIDERDSLTLRRSIQITLAISDALEYMHRLGVVHHDLKPENVVVDAEDNVKLIDFGIAANTRPNLGKRANAKNSIGTPDYVSPEQAKGKRGDPRSDVYSLGIILYEMLTGEVPFSGLNPLTAMSLRSLVDPPCPGEINPAVPPRLRHIIQRAIARDRDKRFPSARDFGSDLSDFLAEELSRPLESLASL
jgi:eukaryotic-like serine/threonine-protein kinase